jgi:hypothetical protein
LEFMPLNGGMQEVWLPNLGSNQEPSD